MKLNSNNTNLHKANIELIADKMHDEAIKLLNAGHFHQGIEKLRKLECLFPNDAGTLYNLGTALVEIGQLDEAIKHLRRAQFIAPTMLCCNIVIARALIEKGALMDARKILERAIKREPNNQYALINLGHCLLLMKESIDIAMDYFKRAIAVDRNHQKAWIGLAKALHMMGNVEEAINAFEHVIALDPDTEVSANARAFLDAIQAIG